MNLFSFLTGKSGKVALKPLLLGTTTVVGLGMATMGGYQADTSKYDRPSRSMAELHNMQDNSVRDRLGLTADGQLTSMPENFRNGSGMGGIRMDEYGGDRLARVDSVTSNLGARLSAANGLSQGGSDVNTGRIERAGTVLPHSPDSTPLAAPTGNGSGGGNGRPGAPQLQRAAMTRASGGSGGGSFGTPGGTGGNGFGNGRGGRGGYGGGQGGPGGYEFSGSMPSSSADLAFGARTSHASFGGGDNTRTLRTRGGRGGQGDLESIAKYSAKVAAKGKREAVNAHGGAFLNGHMTTGLTLDGASAGQTGGSSSDFGAVGNLSRAHKGVDNWSQNKSEELEKQKQARKKLMIEIIFFVAAAVTAAILCASFMKKAKQAWQAYQMAQVRANMATDAASKAAAEAEAKSHLASFIKNQQFGWACVIGTGLAAAYIMYESISFMSKYQGKLVPAIGMILAGASVPALIYIAKSSLAGMGLNAGTSFKLSLKTAFNGVGATAGTGAALKGMAIDKGIDAIFSGLTK